LGFHFTFESRVAKSSRARGKISILKQLKADEIRLKILKFILLLVWLRDKVKKVEKIAEISIENRERKKFNLKLGLPEVLQPILEKKEKK
jgi:hypothetical protein